MADDIKLVIGVDDRDLIRAEKEQLKFQRNLTSIEKAFRSGKINASRYNSELAKQAKELAKLGGGYNKANSEVRKYAASLRQATDAQLEATQAAGFAGKRVNRLGMQMQQAGYQVGDFAVQLQGGTNMMVALGQQGSQLLGIFGPAGAIAGAALAIGTAFVAPLMRASKEADELAKSVKNAIKEVDDALRASMLGATEGEMKFIDSIAVLQTELDKLQKTFSEGGGAASQDPALVYVAQAIQKTKEELNEANKEFRDYQANVAKLKSFDPLSAFGGAGRDIKEQERLKTAVTETGELRLKLAFRRQKLFDAFRASQRKAEGEEQKAADKIAETIERANQSAKDQLRSEGQKIELLEAELKFGKESVRYKNLVALIEDANLRRRLEAQGVEEATIDAIINQLDVQRQLTQEISDSADEAKRIAKAFDDAQAAASKIKPNFAGVLDPRGESGSVTEAMRRGYQFPSSAPEKEPAVKESDLEKLRAQLALETELLGKTEARQRVLEALGIKFVENNPKTVAGLEEQINKNLELVRVEQERIDLAETIGSAMEDSLMSMVDGTKSVKDAFRDMAADIVRHLYKVLVVQQMINAIGGMIGGPVGNEMATMTLDGGGYTGNGPRSGGLDGKGGFMAMMHPRETVIDHTKANSGGTGQNVVINQSFNFQANGDDSVKKIIAQAAPQIANMTKKSLLDDRRRGGTTKAVFG
jgi:hypothetical protein